MVLYQLYMFIKYFLPPTCVEIYFPWQTYIQAARWIWQKVKDNFNAGSSSAYMLPDEKCTRRGASCHPQYCRFPFSHIFELYVLNQGIPLYFWS